MPSALDGPALLRHPLAVALVEVIGSRGYRAASVEQVAAHAGVAVAEFERLFAGKEDATLRVFAALIADFERRVGDAFDRRPSWPASLREAAYEAARWLGDHPAAARFGASLLEGPEMALVMREEALRWCESLIDAGRMAALDPAALPAGAATIAIGGIAEILTRRVREGAAADPGQWVPQLMYGAVRPYLGEEAARAELEIPPPPGLRP